jgi:hypothetical protein
MSPIGLSMSSALTSRLAAAALNPQPLPPREAGAAIQAGKALLDDFCGTVPHKLPPPPPPPFAEGLGLPSNPLTSFAQLSAVLGRPI